ncbi:MAG TPA: alkaline phosphatase family protein, partial [Candidatus Tumulicola sp.]
MPKPGVRTMQMLSLLLVAAAGACSNASPAIPAPDSAPAQAFLENARVQANGKIKHIVIIIQENRSVDNLFQGLPGADTRSYGYSSDGKKINLRPFTLATQWDIEHDSTSYFDACNGAGSYPGTDCRMNGFDKERLLCGGLGGGRCPNGFPQYGYVPRKEARPYFDMAAQYAFGDRMFTSEFDASSFVSHQY